MLYIHLRVLFRRYWQKQLVPKQVYKVLTECIILLEQLKHQEVTIFEIFIEFK